MNRPMTDRKTEILVEGEWKQIHFKELKIGDTFRLFDGTINPVRYKGKYNFVATSEPYVSGLGTLEIEIEES